MKFPAKRILKRAKGVSVSNKVPLICGIIIISMTSDVVVSCTWESVSTDSNEFVGVDVGAYYSENLCGKPAV